MSITEARKSRTDITADLIVIGGGAAGITICREFIGRSEKVCLLEAGGFDYDEQSQDFIAARMLGFPISTLKIAGCVISAVPPITGVDFACVSSQPISRSGPGSR